MTGMTLELSTEQLQLIVIALICASTERHHKEMGWEEDFNELVDVFGELNAMCKPENGYKLTVEVTA